MYNVENIGNTPPTYTLSLGSKFEKSDTHILCHAHWDTQINMLLLNSKTR